MGSDEFVFKLPGDPGFKKEDGTVEYDRKFPLESINEYDKIFGECIHNWECNVRRGFIMIFRVSQNGKDNNPRPVSLGLISVENAKRKFQ